MASPAWDATGGDPSKRPIVLITGPRRSGKTSVHHVVFHKLSPHETMFLGATMSVLPEHIGHNELVHFEVWDLPGDHGLASDIVMDDGTVCSADEALSRCGALIFVVDAQEGVDDDTAELLRDIGRRVVAHAPSLSVDVFVHKIDGDALATPEARVQAQSDAQVGLSRALRESGLGGFAVAFHATSVYDGSVFEAVSRVVQRLLPQRPALTSVLDSFVTMSGMEAAAVYDVVTKVHLARDSHGRGEAMADLISDALDVVVDVSCIYGVKGAREAAAAGGAASGEGEDGAAAGGGAEGSEAGDGRGGEEDGEAAGEEEDEDEDGFQFDGMTESLVSLADGKTLVLRSVGPYLALVAVAPSPDAVAGARLGAVDCNVEIVRKAMRDLFAGGPAGGFASLMLPPPAGAARSDEGSVISAAGSINV